MSNQLLSSNPQELPQPLGDPLLSFGRFIAWFAMPVLTLSLGVRLLLPVMRDRTTLDAIDSTFFCVNFTLLLCALVILPRRRANAIYLRSFRHDTNTGDIRAVLEVELGLAFRLAGIRDPRRRWGWLRRHLFYFLFLFRYASPRFMNLEAGDDWKRRLWRSLADARCAVIDVAELTPFVHEEVELALNTLGPERVLFIVNESRPLDEWRRQIAGIAGASIPSASAPIMAVWSTRPDANQLFRAQIRQFAASVPIDPSGLVHGACPLPSSEAIEPETPATRHWQNWIALVVASLIGLVVIAAITFALRLSNPSKLAALAPGVAYDLLCLGYLIKYSFESGSKRKRVALATMFILGVCVSGLPALADWVAPMEGVRNKIARNASRANLREIGRAMAMYESVQHCLPPIAKTSASGQPLLSWRVLILPELGEQSLFDQFDLSEPWDGPHNARLLRYMPSVYRTAYETDGDPHATRYRVFTGPGAPLTPDRAPPADLAGASNRVLVVETSNAVPWTKPEELPLPTDRRDLLNLINQLGATDLAATRVGTPALMGDLSDHLIPGRNRLNSATLEEMVTGTD